MFDFKILFLYPNSRSMSLVSPSIALFSRLLKNRGYRTDLFDTSNYQSDEEDSDKNNERDSVVKSFDLKDKQILNTNDIYEDLNSKIDSFNPNLIAVSATESTFLHGIKLLRKINSDIPTLLGGVFATFAPQIAIKYPEIDMLCIGEGEKAIVDICDCLESSSDYSHINNLWIKDKDNQIIRNPISPPVDINSNPIPDYEIFDENRLYRAMSGKIYKMLPVETHRGCPFNCGFCNSPAQNRLYKKETNHTFFRKKSIEKVREEIKYCCNTMKAEYIFFWADEFFTYNKKDIDEFCEMYSKFQLPFYCQARPETITDYKIKKLKKVGLDRLGVGIEHGNENFRKNIIGRGYSNDTVLKALKTISDFNIPFSVNNIIGYPMETRSLIMDTIEFNRKIKNADSKSCSIFSPFHGTALRDLAIEKGYLDESAISPSNTDISILRMPQLSSNQILGLRRTFNLYCKVPKKLFPLLKICENDNIISHFLIKILKKIYLYN